MPDAIVYIGGMPIRAIDNLDGTFSIRSTAGLSRSATSANVAASASAVTLLAANTARTGAAISNDSTSLLYLKLGTGASATSFTVEVPGTVNGIASYYEVPAGYTGIVTGMWVTATGAARVTELLP